MPLPENYSPFEFLQDCVRKTLARDVREAFSDLGESWEPDTSTPRSALRLACTPDDLDTGAMLAMRMMFFYMTLRQAQDLQAPIYGIPTGQFHETRRFRPQVCLQFREDLEDVDPDFHPLKAEIKFRLMGESETTITTSDLTSLANRIKTAFGAAGNGYKWKKGKTLCSYTEPDKGYSLHIYAFSEEEGRNVISKVLDCNNAAPNWERLKVNENAVPAQAFPTMPPTKIILGKSTRLPRRRPVGFVRFQRATCAIWGLTKPVALYDRTGRLLDSLVN